ncbi:MAG: hypothetical protein A2252_07740 [Elusimicrobia bacterium RIFOXYA2_FULL_39_19]|nr:MAG: hypothetical protein A2252_07740 [Elusimicrobia bacterium RIFOXYA2_FULL_39_19]
MAEVLLETQKRENQTKSKLKVSRKKGMIPAIVYGSGETTQHLYVKEREIGKIIASGRNTLVNLKLEDASKLVLIKDVHYNVVTSNIMHVDFHIVSLKKTIEVSVPVHIVGECPGVKTQGGILEHVVREIKVRCLATDIPKAINIDVTNLNIGNNIILKDIVPPPNVEFLTTKDSILLNVVAPMKVEETTVADAAAATSTQPEVIAKGKKEEEGAEAAAPGAKDAGKKEAPKADAKAPKKG